MTPAFHGGDRERAASILRYKFTQYLFHFEGTPVYRRQSPVAGFMCLLKYSHY